MIQSALRQRILMVSHHPQIAENLDLERMYDALRRNIYWPRMAADVDHIISTCLSCVRNNLKYSRRRNLQVFPASGLLDYVAKNILEALSKTRKVNQYILAITGLYSKLTRAMQTQNNS